DSSPQQLRRHPSAQLDQEEEPSNVPGTESRTVRARAEEPEPLFWQAATTVSTRRVLYSSTSTQRSGAKGGSGLPAAICHRTTGRLVPVRRWAQSDNPFPCSWCLHESRTALSFQNFECKVCAPVHLEGQMNP